MATPDAILQQESGLDVTPAGNAQLGQLADATPDTMSLHTKDAYGTAVRSASAISGLPAGASQSSGIQCVNQPTEVASNVERV